MTLRHAASAFHRFVLLTTDDAETCGLCFSKVRPSDNRWRSILVPLSIDLRVVGEGAIPTTTRRRRREGHHDRLVMLSDKVKEIMTAKSAKDY